MGSGGELQFKVVNLLFLSLILVFHLLPIVIQYNHILLHFFYFIFQISYCLIVSTVHHIDLPPSRGKLLSECLDDHLQVQDFLHLHLLLFAEILLHRAVGFLKYHQLVCLLMYLILTFLNFFVFGQ